MKMNIETIKFTHIILGNMSKLFHKAPISHKIAYLLGYLAINTHYHRTIESCCFQLHSWLNERNWDLEHFIPSPSPCVYQVLIELLYMATESQTTDNIKKYFNISKGKFNTNILIWTSSLAFWKKSVFFFMFARVSCAGKFSRARREKRTAVQLVCRRKVCKFSIFHAEMAQKRYSSAAIQT